MSKKVNPMPDKSLEMETKMKQEDDGMDSDDSETAESPTGLTRNQNRLLYLISLYTHPAQSAEEQEGWIRKSALQVLMYEGITAKVLDYDYAPSSVIVENRRIFINISQEGKSDVDFLREEELLNGLKLQSREYWPVTCYQVSEKGLELVSKLGRRDRTAVEEIAYAPTSKDLLHVRFDAEEAEYILETASEERNGRTVKVNSYNRKSDITYIEDVSYVSSAYVPQCLRRKGGRPTMSNAHKASLCRKKSNIRDELDEVITLNSVSIIVAEFVPAGANQIVQMNQNLGSMERVQGGFFTQEIDVDSTKTQLEVNPGLTTVDILDYSPTEHVNFEADIHYPEETDIIQVETFGVSVNSGGTNYYGMQVEAVMDRIKDNISVDHLSRLLVDVQQDSSKIIDSCMSAYQRRILNLIYMNDRKNRGKVNLIIANEITPHLTAEEYMDKGEYENELKQILGDTRAAFDISEHDTLIFGEFGLLVAGANARHHEPILCSYISFCATDNFCRTFFVRLYLLLDDMALLRKTMEAADLDPNVITKVNTAHMKLSRELTLMEEILSYMLESLENVEIPPEPPEQAGRTLFERLELHAYRSQILNRCKDLKKNLKGARHELKLLADMVRFTKEERAAAATRKLNDNTVALLEMQQTHSRNQWYMKISMYLLAALLSFRICEGFMGEFSIGNTLWARQMVELLIRAGPFNWWFILQIVVWVCTSLFIVQMADRYLHRSKGNVVYKIEVNKRVLWKNLNLFLAKKEENVRRSCRCFGFPLAGGLNYEHRDQNMSNHIVRRQWTETNGPKWGGNAPTFTIEYDEDTIATIKDSEGVTQETIYLLRVEIRYNRHKARRKYVFNAKELHERFVSVLKNNDVWMSNDHEDYKLLMNDQPNAFYNNGGAITREKVNTAIKGTMESKKKQQFEVDKEEMAATGIVPTQ